MPDIPLWPQCNIGCVFCSNPVEGYRDTTADYTYEKFLEKWEKYKKGEPVYLKFSNTRDYFNLTGGEPTIHPDFLKILGTIRKDFPAHRIKLLSNGRMFFYPEFAQSALKIGNKHFEIAVPVFGHDAKTHEAISRTPKSFEQTIGGLENIFKYRASGQRVEIRIILTAIQIRWLAPTLEFLAARFPEIDSVDFLFVEMEGFAQNYADRLRFTMTEAMEAVNASWGTLQRFKDFRLFHFPLCVVPPRLWPHVLNSLDAFKVTYLEDCQSCPVKERCVGIHRSYLKEVGPSEFHPPQGHIKEGPPANPYRPFALK